MINKFDTQMPIFEIPIPAISAFTFSCLYLIALHWIRADGGLIYASTTFLIWTVSISLAVTTAGGSASFGALRSR